MTNKARAHRKGVKPAKTSQPKTPFEFDPPQFATSYPCLGIFHRESQPSFVEIPLSEEEFMKLLKGVTNSCTTLTDHIAHIICASDRREGADLGELENAIIQSKALYRLLIEKFELIASPDCPDQFSGEDASSFIAGISFLAEQTQTRLMAAHNAILGAIHPPMDLASQRPGAS
jgi:hypothetical protein